MSARITNTGNVEGADAAQLYLGDPAVAGEPPRQLKGIQKVKLRPGESRTVRFTLSGHDLSYWDDAANGWVLPDGRFNVYVGDSSALSDLPLRGSFDVARTLGARYAVLQAPNTIDAGSTGTVTAQVVNDGDYAMRRAEFELRAPAGWTVRGPGAVTVPAHSTVSEPFRVTVPAGATPGTSTLTLSVLPFGGRAGAVQTSTTVVVPYTSLAAAYNNTGISDNSDEAAGDYDGVGDSYSAQALAAGTPTPLSPGSKVTIDGTTLTWPDVPAGTPDNVVTAGQTVERDRHRHRSRVPRREPEWHRDRAGHDQLQGRQ